MKQYIVNWALSGFRNLEHKAGAVIEAIEDEAVEVAALVKAGVLSLIDEESAGVPESPEDLVKLAKDKFNVDLDPALSKDAMLAEIAALEAAAVPELLTKTKVELIAYAKETFNLDLKPALSKDAMLAEIAAQVKK